MAQDSTLITVATITAATSIFATIIALFIAIINIRYNRSNNNKLEQLKSELQTTNHKLNFKFTKLHEAQVDVFKNFFILYHDVQSKAEIVESCFHVMTGTYEDEEETSLISDLNKLHAAFDILHSAYDKLIAFNRSNWIFIDDVISGEFNLLALSYSKYLTLSHDQIEGLYNNKEQDKARENCFKKISKDNTEVARRLRQRIQRIMLIEPRAYYKR